jgi:hypothetical protein
MNNFSFSNQQNRTEQSASHRTSKSTLIEAQNRLFEALSNAEAAHNDRDSGANHTAADISFGGDFSMRWLILDGETHCLERLERELVEMLNEGIKTVLPVARGIAIDAALSLSADQSPGVKTSITEQFERASSVKDFIDSCEDLLGEGVFEGFVSDGLEAFSLLNRFNLALGAIGQLRARALSGTEEMFAFLSAEMFARFDIATTDFGLETRRSFFGGSGGAEVTPLAELQLHRLQSMVGFLMEVGAVTPSDRNRLSSLEPALFEGEVARAFCKYLSTIE